MSNADNMILNIEESLTPKEITTEGRESGNREIIKIVQSGRVETKRESKVCVR